MGLHEKFSQEHAWRKGPGIADGADIEQAVLGMPIIPLKERKDDYMPYAEAVEYVKKYQPNALSRSRIVRDLRMRVADLCVDTDVPVKFFTAVGTPLDIYHGVDAFFEQGGKLVTLDISLRDKDEYKASVLLRVDFDSEGRPIAAADEMSRVAKVIAEKFNADIRRKAA